MIGATECNVGWRSGISRITREWTVVLSALLLLRPAVIVAQAAVPGAASAQTARYDGEDWHLKGDGVVCCPCATPCPCRTNGGATYGHCEATLYLHVREGHYGKVNLKDLRVVNTSGACGMSYEKLAALYFDRSAAPEAQAAFLKLLASFSSAGIVEFPYLRAVTINAVTNGSLLHVSIPDVLEMIVDGNWGPAGSPLPDAAAVDHFSNTLRYIQNLRYRMHDAGAKLDFDYSRRQANYRSIDLGMADYRSRSMLVQFTDGTGWFNSQQLLLINEQHLPLPDLKALSREVSRRREARRGAE